MVDVSGKAVTVREAVSFKLPRVLAD